MMHRPSVVIARAPIARTAHEPRQQLTLALHLSQRALTVRNITAKKFRKPTYVLQS